MLYETKEEQYILPYFKTLLTNHKNLKYFFKVLPKKGLERIFLEPLFFILRVEKWNEGSELLTHNLGQKMVGYANCISFLKLALHIFQNVFLKNTSIGW